jgi:hypothetical protein
MTKKLEEATFSKLVRDIDEKWGHTYEDFEEDGIYEAATKAGWDPKLLVIEEVPLNDKAQ